MVELTADARSVLDRLRGQRRHHPRAQYHRLTRREVDSLLALVPDTEHQT